MRFRVYPEMAMQLTSWDEKTCVISISSPRSKGTARSLIPITCQQLLRVQFHDIYTRLETDHGVWDPMSDDTAREIVKFFLKNLNKTECVIHCEAGISRSPAVAIALSEFCGGLPDPVSLIEQYPTFNRHVYRTMWKALEERQEGPPWKHVHNVLD